MEHPGPVDVQDGVEAVPIPVEKVFRYVLKKICFIVFRKIDVVVVEWEKFETVLNIINVVR